MKNKLNPAFDSNVASIVFATDKFYLPYLSVAITSLIASSSKDHNYDIVVLYTDIDNKNITKFLNSFHLKENFSLRFLNVTDIFDSMDVKDFYIEIHVTLATYLRFFIGNLLLKYDKVLYLDCDILIKEDVYNLYAIDLEGHPIGAASDIREIYHAFKNNNSSGRNWRDYLIDTLGLKDYTSYFQAGVLLLDLDKFRKKDLQTKLLESLKRIKRPILSDQDILNSVLFNQVKYFQVNWNLEWQLEFEYPQFRLDMPEKLKQEYIEALKNPKIIHYASPIKPWKNWGDFYNFSADWWLTARNTMYYEYFLYEWVCPKQFVKENLIIRVVKLACPQGSKRRRVLKKIKNMLSNT